MTLVVKKDGSKQPFIIEKIGVNLDSAERVFNVNIENKEQILSNIYEKVSPYEEIQSEDIYKIIENELKDNPLVLMAFENFKKEKAKEYRESIDRDYQLKRFHEKDPSIMYENGNKDSRTIMTQREILAGTIAKAEGLNKYSERVTKAHLEGLIHLHDLDRSPYHPIPNCSLPDFNYMLKNDIEIGNAIVREPQGIQVAVSKLLQCISGITGEQYGGISVHELDKLLAPYVRKTLEKHKNNLQNLINDLGVKMTPYELEKKSKELTSKDVYDAMQALEYEINTMSTSTSQTPFTTVSYGLDQTWEGRQIQKQHLKVRLKGMDGQTAIFPKIIYFIQDGVNLKSEDPNYDIKEIAMETSAKRIYPDMVSVDNLAKIKGGTGLITPMGCRSFLHYWENKKGEEVYTGRNNLGVVSINLVRLGILSRGNMNIFEDLLDETLELVKDALKTREDSVISAKLEEMPLMYKMGGLGDPKGKNSVRDFYSGERYKSASISIGYIGLHNMMVALTEDEDWQDDSDYQLFALNVIKRLDEYCDKINNGFLAKPSVYASPSESLCERFAKLDQDRFGIIENVNERDYYENSFHYPSYKNTDPFSKMIFESPYYENTPGGFMFYVEQPTLNHNMEAFETIWDAMHHYGVIYGGINSPTDHCSCGFEGEANYDEQQGYTCPNCLTNDPEKLNVVRRLCGYLGEPNKRPTAKGKQDEIQTRVKHK